ncbi:MAG: hypothetical protein LBJ64_00145 [Deltaproteobacteria bacterium]|jgi:nickel transport protein|nr:hypothetical protein [Deltaproteobacteria bacterium]
MDDFMKAGMQPIAAFLALLAIGVLSPLAWTDRAFAHSVFIFAWPQGETICADSYFSGRSPVRGGTVTMTDRTGAVLDSAVTDDEGSVCFPRPRTDSDLTFVVEAGQGHKADFLLRVVDLPPLNLLDSSASPSSLESNGSAPAESPETAGIASFPAGPGADLPKEIDLESLRTMVRQELSAQLGPMARALTEKNAQGPTAKEIVGGLGWLAGLFGFAFWLSGRNNRRKPSPKED